MPLHVREPGRRRQAVSARVRPGPRPAPRPHAVPPRPARSRARQQSPRDPGPPPPPARATLCPEGRCWKAPPAGPQSGSASQVPCQSAPRFPPCGGASLFPTLQLARPREAGDLWPLRAALTHLPSGLWPGRSLCAAARPIWTTSERMSVLGEGLRSHLTPRRRHEPQGSQGGFPGDLARSWPHSPNPSHHSLLILTPYPHLWTRDELGCACYYRCNRILLHTKVSILTLVL